MPCFFSPAAPWLIVPAKKIPGRVALSQKGVWAGSRLWPNVATPSAGRSRSGVTKPVAAITSSAGTAGRCEEEEIPPPTLPPPAGGGGYGPGRFPATAKPNPDPGALRKGLQAFLHLRPRGKVRRPIHQGRHHGPVLFVVGEQTVPVV